MKLRLNTSMHFILVLAAALFFTACGKDGDPGAQGPQGEQGEQGLPGPTGSSDVIYSNWLDVKFKAVTEVQNGQTVTIGYEANVPAPKLTKDILTKGEIKVYVNFNTADAPEIAPLPYYDPEYEVSLNPTFALGNIYMFSNVDASTYTATSPKVGQYRYVLVPGTVNARSDKSIDWNNYSEVKAYLNLKD